MKKKNILITILSMVIVIDAIYLGKWLIDLNKEKEKKEEVKKIVEVSNEEDDGYKITKESFDALRNKYSNVVGYIEFPNDFLSEPIVQGTDNDYYLYRWIDGTKNTQGSVYMDYGCNKENQNITLYGHNVYYDSTARFSPLESLTDQATYDEHHQFKVWFEDSVRTYEIAYVTVYDTEKDKDFDFKVKNFYTDEIYTDFMDWMDQHQQIEPIDGTHIEKTDNLITLQTCVKWHETERHLITAKEVGREQF